MTCPAKSRFSVTKTEDGNPAKRDEDGNPAAGGIKTDQRYIFELTVTFQTASSSKKRILYHPETTYPEYIEIRDDTFQLYQLPAIDRLRHTIYFININFFTDEKLLV